MRAVDVATAASQQARIGAGLDGAGDRGRSVDVATGCRTGTHAGPTAASRPQRPVTKAAARRT